jgi:hypothetical protein
MLFLSIPKPCHENWNEMSPREQGAFCNSCSKIVIDFTTLSDEDVKNYFFQNREQKTCGRFRNDQLTDTNNPLPHLLAEAIPFWKKFLAIVLILFGSFLSGCERPLKGKVAVSTKETTAEQSEEIYTTVGYIMPQTIDTLEINEALIEECPAITGEINPVIIADTSIISEEIAGDLDLTSAGIFSGNVVVYDTDRIVKPDPIKNDTLRKKLLDKHGCEVAKTDSANIIIP